ncbi:MAG: 23S rRNA (uracil(1939)-C(5))-methyltransferase RlmD [Anaerorhabdus sp.]
MVENNFIGKCTGYNDKGQGIVFENGLVYFVSNLIEGEVAELRVIDIKKRYGIASIKKLIETSNNRNKFECSVYDKCGGCQISHLSYSEQLRFKKEKVIACLKNNSDLVSLVNDVIGCSEQLRYRNNVQIHTDNTSEFKMGFYALGSNDVVEFDDCLIQSEKSNKIIKECKKIILKYKLEDAILSINVRYVASSNNIMIIFKSTHDISGCIDFIDEIRKVDESIVSIVMNSKRDKVLFGTKHILENSNGYTFRVNYNSFYQVNTSQTSVLYDYIKKISDVKNTDTIIDLYCGTGTIGITLAKDAKEVFGVELVKGSILNAKYNAKINNIDNIKFICDSASNAAKKLSANKIKPSIVIVDPPRKGCDKELLETIYNMYPEKIIYVSCDFSTCIRDIEILRNYGYDVLSIQPIDMFPNTYHVETVVLMSRVDK